MIKFTLVIYKSLDIIKIIMEINIGNLKFDLDLKKGDGYYTISANSKAGEKLGYLTFLLKKEQHIAWLNKIAVDESVQGCGVGYAMLVMFEKFASDNFATKIEGKYYPTNDRAIEFYKRNGYLVLQEDYGKEIFKRLNSNEVESAYNNLGFKCLESEAEK